MTYLLTVYLLGVYFTFSSLVCYFRNEVIESKAVRREILLASLGNWFTFVYLIWLFEIDDCEYIHG